MNATSAVDIDVRRYVLWTNLTKYVQSPARTADLVAVPVTWGIMMLIGVLGNGLVLYVVLCYGSRNATNCYIVNLAITDLAFLLLGVPLTMTHYILPSWTLGIHLCRFLMYVTYVTFAATSLTLIAMTFDRYMAVVHPITFIKCRTPRTAVVTSILVWAVSLLLNVPFAMYHGLVHSYFNGPHTLCREVWPTVTWGRVALGYIVTVTYVLPLVVIVLCYYQMIKKLRATYPGRSEQHVISKVATRRRSKAVKMLAAVVTIFAMAWLPIHVFHLWFKFDSQFPTVEATYIFKMIAHALSFSNSCTNPVVYCFMGDGFRASLRKAFPRFLHRNRVRPSFYGSSRTHAQKTTLQSKD